MAKLVYEQMEDGEWYELPQHPKYHIRLACCDCGLVHDVWTRISGKTVEQLVIRNNRATASYRRKWKFPRDDD